MPKEQTYNYPELGISFTGFTTGDSYLKVIHITSYLDWNDALRLKKYLDERDCYHVRIGKVEGMKKGCAVMSFEFIACTGDEYCPFCN